MPYDPQSHRQVRSLFFHSAARSQTLLSDVEARRQYFHTVECLQNSCQERADRPTHNRSQGLLLLAESPQSRAVSVREFCFLVMSSQELSRYKLSDCAQASHVQGSASNQGANSRSRLQALRRQRSFKVLETKPQSVEKATKPQSATSAGIRDAGCR